MIKKFILLQRVVLHILSYLSVIKKIIQFSIFEKGNHCENERNRILCRNFIHF